MSIRSMMLALAVSFVGVATVGVGTAAAGGGGGFNCVNKNNIQVVSCVGSIAVLPININVKDVSVLDNNKLAILDDDLNQLSILDGNILDNDQILNDVKATVLTDFLDKFLINVSDNDVNVCTAVLGVQLCK